MIQDRNPQAAQMADASMVRNLAAQAEAIWPQEAPLFDRYLVPPDATIADIGCGTGEITARLARLYPLATLVGIDVLDEPLAHARREHASLAPRVRFERGDAFHLAAPSDAYDLVVCRHLTQAVPEPEAILAEMARVCRPGGWLHVLSEDYGMLHIARGDERLWVDAVGRFARATGTDEHIGRRTWSVMRRLGFVDLRVDYVNVDTVRVPRVTLAEIFRAWRDGYAEAVDERAGFPPGEARLLFDAVIAAVLDPDQYSVWHIPVVSGRKPA